jgi:hypothetical protein
VNECWSIWVIGKVAIQQRLWKDWTSFRSHCCPIHHILLASHLVTSPLLVGARTQCEVNNSKRQKLFECLDWIYPAIWIPALVSQCTANGSQDLDKWSLWLGNVIITMPLKSDCIQRTELEVGQIVFGAPISSRLKWSKWQWFISSWSKGSMLRRFTRNLTQCITRKHLPFRPLTSGVSAFTTGEPNSRVDSGLAGLENVVWPAISLMLQQRPLLSHPILAWHFMIVKAKCLRIVDQDLGLQKFHRLWIPYPFDSTQGTSDETISSTSSPGKSDGSYYIIHMILSWQHLETGVLCEPSKPLTPWNVWSQSWGPSTGSTASLKSQKGSPTINFLSNVVMPSLVDGICPHSRRRSLKALRVHLDNLRHHNWNQSSDCLRATKIRRMAQPAYSPNRTRSEFWLFGYLKEQLQGTTSRTGRASKGWVIKRLEWVIENRSEYYNTEMEKKRNKFEVEVERSESGL